MNIDNNYASVDVQKKVLYFSSSKYLLDHGPV